MTDVGETGLSLRIRELCATWRKVATRDGGISIGGESERFRLHNNGIRFHDLGYSELTEALVGLTEVLLLPGLNTVVDLDHTLLWAWCGELLLGPGAPLADVDPEIRQLAETTVRAALANVTSPTAEGFERSRTARGLMGSNASEYLARAHNVLPFLAFPLLEAVVRRACKEFVGLDGVVIEPFSALGRSYKPGKRCSNVGHLLRLLVERVATEPLRENLITLLLHVEGLSRAVRHSHDGQDGYDVIFEWRNSSLHGETSLSTIGGTVLNLALLIALDSIMHEFEQHRVAALGRAQREVDMSEHLGRWSPSPWSYYPPFHEPGSEG